MWPSDGRVLLDNISVVTFVEDRRPPEARLYVFAVRVDTYRSGLLQTSGAKLYFYAVTGAPIMSPTLAGATAERVGGAAPYQRHWPERTLLYQIVEQYYPVFVAHMAQQERPLPDYVQQEFEDYLRCGRLEHGFLRVRCDTCHAEHLVAFSCRRRGFCPSCGARRMVESAALLVDEVFPEQPVRQWVLSFPYPLRFLFASRPAIMGQVLGIVYRAIAGHLINKAGFTRKRARAGAVTLIQRFGSALNLNLHLMCMDARTPRAQDAQERPTCCSWMGSMSWGPMERSIGFAG